MHAVPRTLPRFFWHFIKKQPLGFFVILIAPIAHILESNVQPYALKWMVDELVAYQGPKDKVLDVLINPIYLYFGVWIGWIIIWRSQEWVWLNLFPIFHAHIRMETFKYVQGHSHQYFTNHFAGSIAGKISDLPRSMGNLLEIFRWRITTTAAVVLTSIGMLAMISPIFSVIIGTWVAVQIYISIKLSRRIDKFASIHAENRNALQGKIVDVLTNITPMRLFSRRRFEDNYIGISQNIEKDSHKKALVEMWKIRMLSELPAFLMGLALMSAVIYGWQQGWVSLGDLVFILYTCFNLLHFVWMMSMDIPTIFSEVGTCKQALTLINRPHEIIDSEDAKPLKVTKGEIIFDKVHFNYIPGKDIFSNKNITIRAGEKVGLVGFSGSGKSTFVNLILRLYDVESGRILIDGQDISKVTQESLRENIAMIPQDASLFHRTLMENIRYGRIDASDEEVIKASKLAHCNDFILKLQEGYNALVGERGIKLSGGQRQRIAIARAILKNAPILILDEATSSLDSVTEKYIQESLHSLMKNRTTIVIAHRLSTLSEMDRILVFKEGQIIEDGSHEELLKTSGHYAMLWQMQAGGFLPDVKE